MIYSKPCEYAIRALSYLARFSNGTPIQGREIAKEEGLPAPVLGKVLQGLVRKGLLESRPGPGGGFRLSRRPELILLRDIVAAIDGLDHFMQCVLGLPQCGEDAPCPLHQSWKELRGRIFEDMDTTTLAQMAQAAERKKELVRKRKGNA